MSTVLFHCEECNSPMVNIRTGAVCPNGHGRIYAKLSAGTNRKHTAIVSMGLGYARSLIGGLYEVPGREGRYVMKERITKLICERPRGLDEDDVLALDEKGVIVLAPAGRRKK